MIEHKVLRRWRFHDIQPGKRFKAMTVSQLRKKLAPDTGWGPEGFQFLSISHPHFADLMNERKLPFMALADYDVAPYGYNDFFDEPQLFCSNNKLGWVSEIWTATILFLEFPPCSCVMSRR